MYFKDKVFTITFRLGIKEYNFIIEESKKRNCSISEAVRKIIEERRLKEENEDK